MTKIKMFPRVSRDSSANMLDKLVCDLSIDRLEEYWGCHGTHCRDCAVCNGKMPSDYYGSMSCHSAMQANVVERAYLIGYVDGRFDEMMSKEVESIVKSSHTSAYDAGRGDDGAWMQTFAALMPLIMKGGK